MDYDYLVNAFSKFQAVSGTLQNSIYHTLKEAIFFQKLPGEITESQISLALNVSRTPVREAMHKLSAEGFLEIVHGKKAKVIYITEQDIRDIATVLRGLHNTSIELCIDKITDSDLDELKGLLDLMEYYVDKHDIGQLVQYNTKFHLKICQCGHNKWLYNIMKNLLNTSLVFRAQVTERPGRAEHGLEEHKTIYRLLCERNGDELKRFMERHVKVAFEQA